MWSTRYRKRPRRVRAAVARGWEPGERLIERFLHVGQDVGRSLLGRRWEAVITVGELGEFGLIAAITAAMAAAGGAGAGGVAAGVPAGVPAGAVLLGAGDDAAVVRAPDGRVVATTDMLIEGRHFRSDWSSAADIGHKAAARNLADVAAMGAVPTALLVGFAGPGRLAVEWVTQLAAGIAAECASAGATVAGGDTSSAETVLLAITALGDLGGREPVTRGGARPGDVVAVAGTLGSAAAGLDLLSADLLSADLLRAELVGVDVSDAGVVGAGSGAGGGGAGVVGERGGSAGVVGAGVAGAGVAGLIGAHRRPSPPYAAGPQAAALGATSMIDVSDGLIGDLGHVARASGVRIELRSAFLAAEPIAQVSALRQAAKLLGAVDWRHWVLTGGDDHALVATFPPDVALPRGWTTVGTIVNGRGVAVDGELWTDAGGWEHFRA